MTSIPHLLVHEHDDNVGVVVVEGLKSGTKMLCCITADNSTFELEAMADVPIGHKVALDDLKKGDTATNATKLAKIETGAEIQVPLFINENDKVKIDIRQGKYVERVK